MKSKLIDKNKRFTEGIWGWGGYVKGKHTIDDFQAVISVGAVAESN